VADKPVAGDQLYVVPPLPVSVVDDPAQIATDDPALIVGIGLTVTVTFAVLLQPKEEPVNAYVVVRVGVAVTLAPVVADKPVAGDQLYVVPPLPVSVVEVPAQIATDDPALIVGIGLTVTVTFAVLLQPKEEPVNV